MSISTDFLQAVRPPQLDRIDADRLVAVADVLEPGELQDAVRYLLSSGGKQLRPAMVLETARYGPEPRGERVDAAALSVELLHVGSLAHDDIVDGGELRRAWASTIEHSGIVTAGSAASWVFAKALETACQLGQEAVRQLVTECKELCDGQLMDSQDLFDTSRTRDRYMQTIDRKTSSLFRLASSMGAIASRADSDVVETLRVFAHHLGLVFQMSDDVLDLVGTEEALGKPPGADLKHGVYTLAAIVAVERDPSLPALLPQAAADEEALAHAVEAIAGCGAVEQAFEEIQRHAALAEEALASLSCPEPEAADRLRAVLTYAVERARPSEAS